MTGRARTTMRPLPKTVPFAAARALVEDAAMPLTRTIRTPLADSAGRVLATPVIATRDVPPFNRAAMDGFAVRASDTAGASRTAPQTLKRVETVHTGSVPTVPLAAGQCTEIATGAPLPDGSDAVVMVEATERESDDAIRILTAVRPAQHVGRRGADIRAGECVVDRGALLTPSRIGAIAALGIGDLEVFDRPTVALLSTGNEIVDPGLPLGPGQIYDINRYTLTAVVQAHGGCVRTHSTVGDSIPALEDAVTACLQNDVIVFSGGSSVGERDLTLEVVAAMGEVVFHGVAVKPGKPTLFGRIGKTLVFGMPGYPTSCLSNAYMLLAPLLRKMAHLPPARAVTVTVPAAQRIVSAPGRHQFYTVRVVENRAVAAFKASGDITSMSRADGYIEIPAETDIVDEGEMVRVTLF